MNKKNMMNSSEWTNDARHHARGTKRTRNSQEEKKSKSSDLDDEDVDVPLSKKINRLNIEYSTKDGSQQSQETFEKNYPYEPSSTYYQDNKLLNSLHEERIQRAQQLSLHKALNSHLKL